MLDIGKSAETWAYQSYAYSCVRERDLDLCWSDRCLVVLNQGRGLAVCLPMHSSPLTPKVLRAPSVTVSNGDCAILKVYT